MGTPQYLSPESLMGMQCPKSDVWCCGIILHMLLKGHYPFIGTTKAEIIGKIKR
jgi:serine/threonine protein kinase